VRYGKERGGGLVTRSTSDGLTGRNKGEKIFGRGGKKAVRGHSPRTNRVEDPLPSNVQKRNGQLIEVPSGGSRTSLREKKRGA